MMVTDSPFGPQFGVGAGHAGSPPAHGKQTAPGATENPSEPQPADQAPRAVQADNNTGGGNAKSADSPAHQARALRDAQAALDSQQAKLPFGHIVRLFAQGDAEAAAALFAVDVPDEPGSDALDEDAAAAPPADPEGEEVAAVEFAPQLDEGDIVADMLEEILDESTGDTSEQV